MLAVAAFYTGAFFIDKYAEAVVKGSLDILCKLMASFPMFAVGGGKDYRFVCVEDFHSNGFAPLGMIIDAECNDHKKCLYGLLRQNVSAVCCSVTNACRFFSLGLKGSSTFSADFTLFPRWDSRLKARRRQGILKPYDGRFSPWGRKKQT